MSTGLFEAYTLVVQVYKNDNTPLLLEDANNYNNHSKVPVTLTRNSWIHYTDYWIVK